MKAPCNEQYFVLQHTFSEYFLLRDSLLEDIERSM